MGYDCMSSGEDIVQKGNKMWMASLCILFVIILASLIVLASVPPVSRDALIHHLAIPKLYLKRGYIYEIPDLSFSYYPMNLDLIYLVALWLKNDILPKYIHLCFGLATAYLIYRYLRVRISICFGLVGAIFYLTIPIVVRMSITAYVDLGLVFFSSASLFLIFEWLRSNFKTSYLVYSGVFCGLAMGTKYNGIISYFLISLLMTFFYLRSSNHENKQKKAIVFFTVFSCVAITVVSPWLIRNYTWTNNPIYPLFNNFFSSNSMQVIETGTNLFTYRMFFFKESFLQIIMLPIRIFFEGVDDSPQYFDGVLNPFLLILPCMAFINNKYNKKYHNENIIMIIYVILFFVFTEFNVHMRIRYLLPIVPFLVILSVVGLSNIYNMTSINNILRYKNIYKYTSIVIMFLLIFYDGKYLVNQFKIVNPFPYISGDISRDSYISGFREEYPVIMYANNAIEHDSLVLCLFMGYRSYYMDFEFLFDRPTDKDSYFNGLIVHSQDSVSIKNALLEKGIRFILIRNDLFLNWMRHIDTKKSGMVALFLRDDATLLYNENGYSFVAIE